MFLAVMDPRAQGATETNVSDMTKGKLLLLQTIAMSCFALFVDAGGAIGKATGHTLLVIGARTSPQTTTCVGLVTGRSRQPQPGRSTHARENARNPQEERTHGLA